MYLCKLQIFPFLDVVWPVTIMRKRILVLPAASRPSIKIRISLLPNIFDSSFPISILSIFLRYFVDILQAAYN